MDILLQRLDAVWDWQPMRRLVAAWKAHRRESLLLVVPALQSEAMPKRPGSSSVRLPSRRPPSDWLLAFSHWPGSRRPSRIQSNKSAGANPIMNPQRH